MKDGRGGPCADDRSNVKWREKPAVGLLATDGTEQKESRSCGHAVGNEHGLAPLKAMSSGKRNIHLVPVDAFQMALVSRLICVPSHTASLEMAVKPGYRRQSHE